MGIQASAIHALTALVTAVIGLVHTLRSDSASGSINDNPVMEELEAQVREAQRAAQAAERRREQAEEEREQAEDQRRQADQARAGAEDIARRAEEGRRLAEEASRRAEERAAQAAREIRKAEEDRRRVEDEGRRAGEDQRFVGEQRQRYLHIKRQVEDRTIRSEEARRKAEDDMRWADEQKRKAEEEIRQMEEERRQADEARLMAERQQTDAEGDRRRIEVERRKAQEDERLAIIDQMKAEQAKVEAERAAEEARAAHERAMKALKEGIRPLVIPTMQEFEATKRRLQYREGMFHFAIAGVSGSGKSSLINAFRGLRNNSRDPLTARTGVVETTAKITRFADPDPANPFVWYDVPGAGTLAIPDWAYFNEQGLYIFDCIIVLTDNRFTQTDDAILRNCARFNIPAYIVRSKSKQNIQNVLEDMPDDDGEDDEERFRKARKQYIAETRKSVAENLDRAQLPRKRVYLVDKDALVQVVKGQQPMGVLDEWDLLKDLLSEARARRVKPRLT